MCIVAVWEIILQQYTAKTLPNIIPENIVWAHVESQIPNPKL